MSKNSVVFNDKEYFIDESSLSAATAELRKHFSTVMNGSGAVINFGGTSYSIDSAKLSAAKNEFVSHLGTISGNDYNVVVGGVAYSVNYDKLQGVIAEIEAVLGDLREENPEGDSIRLLSSDNLTLTDINGLFFSAKEEK